jgi:hypothetical protein
LNQRTSEEETTEQVERGQILELTTEYTEYAERKYRRKYRRKYKRNAFGPPLNTLNTLKKYERAEDKDRRTTEKRIEKPFIPL